MATDRRSFLQASSAALAFIGTAPSAGFGNANAVRAARSGPASASYRPVHTPNGKSLPFKMVGGVKVFHLIAEDVMHSFAPGLMAACWGYNGGVHGPTIEAVEGDTVRIYVTNRLDVPTTVHWHGLIVPNGMDGVGGLSQRPIEPGETFKYEFPLLQEGTFMYHSHHDEMTQMAMGLMGMIVVHPREAQSAPPDRDYVYMLSEWKIAPGARRPDPLEMTDFTVLTLNASIFPATEPLLVKSGERIRIRIGNLSAMDHHPIHLHGHVFHTTATDGGIISPGARWPETSVLVPVGSTRTIEFTAGYVGDWAMHCHMTHHVMTQMGHGLPNTIGIDPSVFDEALLASVPEYETMGEDDLPVTPSNSVAMLGGRGPQGYITMGGMFTVLKVRESIEGVDPKAWAPIDPATQADLATAEQLSADGIDV
jgi:FtsP/CotA-like multicopper oxidase with cupredoxin domain